MPTEESGFTLINVQAAIFTPETSTYSMSRVLSSVLSRHASVYNGEVQSLPFPDLPNEVPRVVLQSSDQTWRFQSSPPRTDSFWIRLSDNIADEKATIQFCTDTLVEYVRTAEVIVSRIGLIVCKACVTVDNTNGLMQRFVLPDVAVQFTPSLHFELANVQRGQVNGYAINKITRFRSANLTFTPEPVIVVDCDVSTIEDSENTHRFDSNQLEEGFSLLQREAIRQSTKYFPKGA